MMRGCHNVHQFTSSQNESQILAASLELSNLPILLALTCTLQLGLYFWPDWRAELPTTKETSWKPRHITDMHWSPSQERCLRWRAWRACRSPATTCREALIRTQSWYLLPLPHSLNATKQLAQLIPSLNPNLPLLGRRKTWYGVWERGGGGVCGIHQYGWPRGPTIQNCGRFAAFP